MLRQIHVKDICCLIVESTMYGLIWYVYTVYPLNIKSESLENSKKIQNTFLFSNIYNTFINKLKPPITMMKMQFINYILPVPSHEWCYWSWSWPLAPKVHQPQAYIPNPTLDLAMWTRFEMGSLSWWSDRFPPDVATLDDDFATKTKSY